MNRSHKIITGAIVAILAGSVLLECGIIAPGIALIVIGVCAALTTGFV